MGNCDLRRIFLNGIGNAPFSHFWQRFLFQQIHYNLNYSIAIKFFVNPVRVFDSEKAPTCGFKNALALLVGLDMNTTRLVYFVFEVRRPIALNRNALTGIRIVNYKTRIQPASATPAALKTSAGVLKPRHFLGR